MEARGDDRPVYGAMRVVIDREGRLMEVVPVDDPKPGWWLMLQFTWDALFHRKGPTRDG